MAVLWAGIAVALMYFCLLVAADPFKCLINNSIYTKFRLAHYSAEYYEL
jgi:hypothetical protein